MDGSFQINRLELVMGSPDDAGVVGRTVANNDRSLLGVLVDAHVGKLLCDELFLRLQRWAEERAQEDMRFPHVVCAHFHFHVRYVTPCTNFYDSYILV